MSSPTPDDLRFARLAALADDDPDASLDATGREAARADAGSDGALAARIAEQRQLREACARVVDHAANRCPDDLRARLTAAVGDPERVDESAPVTASGPNAASEPDSAPPAVAGRIGPGRWIGVLAAAALIAISTVAVVGVLKQTRTNATRVDSAAIVQVLNATRASALDARHRLCGDDPSKLFQHATFPETLDGLDERLAEKIDASIGSTRLDLSDLGYHYTAAGNCNVPGPGAVHIVYQNDAGKALSLWLRPDDGTLSLEPGRVYGPPADSPQAGRIRVWLDGDVVLYLVGDLARDVEAARPELALFPA